MYHNMNNMMMRARLWQHDTKMFGCHPLNVRHATMVSRHLLLLYVFCTTACRGFFFSSNITCYCNNESMLGDKHRLCVQNRCTSDKSLVECYVQRVEPDKVRKWILLPGSQGQPAQEDLYYNLKKLFCKLSMVRPSCSQIYNKLIKISILHVLVKKWMEFQNLCYRKPR